MSVRLGGTLRANQSPVEEVVLQKICLVSRWGLRSLGLDDRSSVIANDRASEMIIARLRLYSAAVGFWKIMIVYSQGK